MKNLAIVKLALILLAGIAVTNININAQNSAPRSTLEVQTIGGSIGTPTAGPLLFTIHGKKTFSYIVQVSYDNLITWHDVTGTVLATQSDPTVVSPAPTNAHAFYRYQELPQHKLTITTSEDFVWFRNSYAVGGTTNDIGAFDITTSPTEGVTLSHIPLQLRPPTGLGVRNIDSVVLWSGTNCLGRGGFTNNSSADIIFTSPLIIASATNVPITVSVEFAKIGSGFAGHSGDQISIDVDVAQLTGTGNVSGSQINAVGYGECPDKVVVQSSISIQKIPLPVAGLDTIGDTNGLMRFSISASAGGSVSIGKMGFYIETVGIGPIFSLQVTAYSDAACSTPIAHGLIAPPQSLQYGGGIVEFYPQDNHGNLSPLQIPANNTYYFRIDGGFGGDKDNASITVTLITEEGGGTGTFNQLDTRDYNFFLWSPNSAGMPDLDTSTDWYNSFGVLGMWPDGISQTRTN